jgi:NAD(P)-dependent dehydrogenase (short-subunit alcohol dehydrogenase family)
VNTAVPTVIVTGASSGIGEAIARAWGKRGATLVLSARNGDELARVARAVDAAGGRRSRAIVQRGDVTREEDRQKLIERARSETGRIDVLVNNAGRGCYGSVARIEASDLEALFALNTIAPLRLTQLALDPLTRSAGTVVMISSVAGIVAGPRMRRASLPSRRSRWRSGRSWRGQGFEWSWYVPAPSTRRFECGR